MTYSRHEFNAQVSKPVHLKYLLHVPDEYDGLLLFLHGSGERGEDADLLTEWVQTRLLEHQPTNRLITLVPLCPAYDIWSLHLDSLSALLDEVISSYKIDPARVYGTGVSMGGGGLWQLALKEPQRFAALAPVCPWIDWMIGDDVNQLGALAHIPIWIFHGEDDEAVPIAHSEKTIEVLQSRGATVKLSRYPGVGHNVWHQAYSEPSFFPWLLQYPPSLD